jgi:tRNA U34 5-methylaminomethyl-2-thiouridine-forming methyltransferase MnmC
MLPRKPWFGVFIWAWTGFTGGVDSSGAYRLVRLANGVASVRCLAVGETCHPVVGPVAEAEALYVRQLDLRRRIQAHAGEFVVWDVGLGAAGNALTVLRATSRMACSLRLVSFDHTLEPLTFALANAEALGYLRGYEQPVSQLISQHEVALNNGFQQVHWELCLADFPTWLSEPQAQTWPKPRVIMFDPYSPVRNPAMWTQPLFERLFALLDPARSCAMATYSRSTMLRVSWLLAGFYVGAGQATGAKEETSIAANDASLLAHPLDRRWLLRARRSTSAEPLWTPVYQQARLSAESWEKLRAHPQFWRVAV